MQIPLVIIGIESGIPFKQEAMLRPMLNTNALEVTPLKARIRRRAVGRLFHTETESLYPGWYVQYLEEGQLRTVRLFVPDDLPLSDAVTEAATFLECPEQSVQIGGTAWT